MYAEDGVRAMWYGAIVSQSLSEAVELFSVRLNPMFSVAGAAEFIVFGQLARVGVNGSAVKSPMSVVAVCGVVRDGVGV